MLSPAIVARLYLYETYICMLYTHTKYAISSSTKILTQLTTYCFNLLGPSESC